MRLRLDLCKTPALAALALSSACLVAPAAQAATVPATYLIDATDFDQGGSLTGSISGTLLEWLAAPNPPFAAGSGRMTLPDTSSFSVSFSGSSVLPDANFDLSDVISLTLVDDGTFGASGGQPASSPAMFVLTAYDAASDSDLFIRFATLAGAASLLGGDEGIFIDWRADDVGTRGTQVVSVRLQGGPAPVPVTSTLALSLLGLSLLSMGRRAAAR